MKKQVKASYSRLQEHTIHRLLAVLGDTSIRDFSLTYATRLGVAPSYMIRAVHAREYRVALQVPLDNIIAELDAARCPTGGQREKR